jgi:NADPH-ferrihemoprotein reductase
MIAAGTGIAPFRGFIMERAQNSASGKMLLFFGCRNESEFLYKDELQHLEKELNGRLEIIMAFSRQGKKKCYVQHKIKEYGEKVRDAVVHGGNVYICGAASMARDVEGAIIEALKEEKGEDAEKFVKETMKKTRRLQEDVW